jgi:hypothetical protein
MRMWGMKPWRCRECMRRFYLPRNLDRKLLREHEWLREIDKSFDPRPKPKVIHKR